MAVGDKYVVIDEADHGFPLGSIITKVRVNFGSDYDDFIGRLHNGMECPQVLSELQVSLLAEATSAVATEPAEDAVTKREKCVYSVEDDKYQYTLTRDRELAREVKADLGGKKAGVVIIRYVATNEIR